VDNSNCDTRGITEKEREMFTLIRDFMDFMKLRKRRKIAVKKFMIRQNIEKFYKDLEAAKGEELTVPAWQITNQIMRDYVKTEKDVNKFYKKMELAGLV
jgi:hypothetical protein